MGYNFLDPSMDVSLEVVNILAQFPPISRKFRRFWADFRWEIPVSNWYTVWAAMNYLWDRLTLPGSPCFWPPGCLIFHFFRGSKAADAEPSPYKPGVRNESCNFNPILFGHQLEAKAGLWHQIWPSLSVRRVVREVSLAWWFQGTTNALRVA